MIFHIAAAAAWHEAVARGTYAADSLGTEGFIHCSDRHQVVRVANARFRHRADLVMLQIDPARLEAPLRYENCEGGDELFPHVYGPLPMRAIVRAVPFAPQTGGEFGEDQLEAFGDDEAMPATTGDETVLHHTAHAMAAAIGRRDVTLLADLLAPGFTYRSDGASTTADADAFLDGIRNIPGEILFVRLERVAIDMAGSAAMLTGVQHAQVAVDGHTIDDRRGFADLFVRIDGSWKLRAGADFPLAASK